MKEQESLGTPQDRVNRWPRIAAHVTHGYESAALQDPDALFHDVLSSKMARRAAESCAKLHCAPRARDSTKIISDGSEDSADSDGLRQPPGLAELAFDP